MVGSKIQIEPVATLHSPFDEKFGIPRQSGLVEAAMGEVRFIPPYDNPAMLDALSGFSHLWLIFQFSGNAEAGWRPRVRPPRLGGNRQVGVWASRSPFRPNALGLSVVRLLEVVTSPKPLLRVSGVDLLDGTPIVDIKPYLPYSDAIPDASAGYAAGAPQPRLDVDFLPEARRWLESHGTPGLTGLVVDVLALDPRPAYRAAAEPDRIYGMRLAGHEIRWRVTGAGVEVCSVAAAESG